MVRLQKYLADCGIASRRKCEELILMGRVSVNDIEIEELGTKVDPAVDCVKVNGKIVKKEEKLVYIMLHKPEGYITSAQDQFERPTVLDLLEGVDERVYPVGRLDYDTSGLILLTNDGELTFKLTHPKHNVEKVYIAKVEGKPSHESLERFREGLFINGYKTAPAEVFPVKDDGKWSSLKVVIKEGKNRQIRNMFDEIGHHVVGLKRIATGNLYLGELAKGEYRYLTKDEVDYLINM